MGFNILIVDDEKNIREGLSVSLEIDGFNTLLAEDGFEALNILTKEDVDLVISDLRMPYSIFSSFELCAGILAYMRRSIGWFTRN